MEYIELGSTGVRVSAIGLGTNHYGSRTSERDAHALLDQFTEAGGTLIDTANVYASWFPGCSGGESETTIGRWMKKRSNRESIFICTKVGFAYPGTERGLRPAIIEQECEKSLQRLGIETIDLYYTHVDDRDTPLTEILQALQRLVEAGKVRFIGASNLTSWRLAESRLFSQLNGWPAYCAVQQRYGYLRPRAAAISDLQPHVIANEDLFDYCRSNTVTPIAYRALLRGAYTRSDVPLPEQYVGPDSDARLAALTKVANETDASLNQVVIAWLRQSDPPVLPLVGASKPEQLEENLGALKVLLSDDQMSRLNGAGA